MTQKQSGFTLIEILIAIAIVGLMTAIVVPGLMSYLENAKVSKVQTQLKVFKTAIEQYYAVIGEFPQTLKDLIKKPENEVAAEKWNEPFLDAKEVPKDPWGQAYIYNVTAENAEHPFELYSKGKPGSKKTDRCVEYLKKSGFTIIEILVAIAIVGLLMTTVLPNLSRLTKSNDRLQFISRLQTLVQLGWQSALASGKIYQVKFDMQKDKRVASLHELTGALDIKGEPITKPAKVYFASSKITWPDTIQIKQFFIEGFDEIGRRPGATQEIWFYIMPDGLAQSVVINAVDTKDKKNNKPREFSLVLSPFSGVFKIYETFQK